MCALLPPYSMDYERTSMNRYTKALDSIRAVRKERTAELKVDKERLQTLQVQKSHADKVHLNDARPFGTLINIILHSCGRELTVSPLHCKINRSSKKSSRRKFRPLTPKTSALWKAPLDLKKYISRSRTMRHARLNFKKKSKRNSRPRRNFLIPMKNLKQKSETLNRIGQHYSGGGTRLRETSEKRGSDLLMNGGSTSP